MAFVCGRFGKSRHECPNLVTFLEPSYMNCTRHQHATYFSPPSVVGLCEWTFNLPMHGDPMQSQRIQVLGFWIATSFEHRVHFVKNYCFFHCFVVNSTMMQLSLTFRFVKQYENTTASTVRVAATCNYATSVFYIVDILMHNVSWMCKCKEYEQ